MKCSLCSRWSCIPSECDKTSNAILFHKDSSAVVRPYLRLRCMSADLSQIFMWGQLSGACALFWHCTHLYFSLLRASSRSKAAIPLFEPGKPVGCTFALGRCNKEAGVRLEQIARGGLGPSGSAEQRARSSITVRSKGNEALDRSCSSADWQLTEA